MTKLIENNIQSSVRSSSMPNPIVVNNALNSLLEEKPKSAKEHIIYETTRDPVWLQKYIELRQSLYDTDPRFKGFRYFDYVDREDYSDPNSALFIARIGSKCVGGVRLTIRRPNSEILLPLEHEIVPPAGKKRYLLREEFPEFDLENKSYAEVSRMVIHPDYRRSDCFVRLLSNLINMAKEQGVSYMFALSDLARSREYKILVRRVFDIDGKIYTDIDLPLKEDHEGFKRYLMMWYWAPNALKSSL